MYTLQLTKQELEMLVTSMEYTKQAFQSYGDYPSFEFKLKRIGEAKELLNKLCQVKKES
jgi:hypothetical protein